MESHAAPHFLLVHFAIGARDDHFHRIADCIGAGAVVLH
jgi:hypothetical protein